jgi:tRNA-dihydrouridine synthase B
MKSEHQIGPVNSRIRDLAPMSGVTDLPFRRLVSRAGAGARGLRDRGGHDPAELAIVAHGGECARAPMAVQLAGCEPHVMAEAARLNDRGAALIDINFAAR